jgi:hypothetical protein
MSIGVVLMNRCDISLIAYNPHGSFYFNVG